MVEHVVSDHSIDARVRERQCLSIGKCVGKAFLAKQFACLLKHAWRKICESNLPVRRDALAIAPPEPARSTTQFQNPTSLAWLEMVKDPGVEAIGVGAK